MHMYFSSQELIEGPVLTEWTKNKKLIDWIRDAVTLCTPQDVHLCDGSEEEWNALWNVMISKGSAIPLNPSLRPNSFLVRSDPADVARVEKRTFICSHNKEDAGPTNNWVEPSEMKKKLYSLFDGCMRGRTMYVIPYCMGPLGSPMSKIGIEISDSPYVVCNMKIMTRMGNSALNELNSGAFFVPCMHSVGAPLADNEQDNAWPCNPLHTCIAHFPETREIWSFGSGYGGNALLGKKCYALRIASVMARDEGWLAEHMLILGITDPKGRKIYITAAFPSACGKTNLAMLTPTLPGWKVECVGDDIAWIKPRNDGRLYAINPENGFFGVAPGTSAFSNPNAIGSLEKNCIFTNVALTPDGDVWWEGMTETPPENLIDWKGKPWSPQSGEKAAHPNSRFTAPLCQCPVADDAYNEPLGVPISAIIVGGRRANTLPLVREANSWEEGILMGASISSEKTAAAEGAIGEVAHDPFAMNPFCGYNMGDYFSHWLDMKKKSTIEALPTLYSVNWFRKQSGTFLWPGFGDNSRILKWIFERCMGEVDAVKTAIGLVPSLDDLDTSTLTISKETMNTLLAIDNDSWKREIDELKEYFKQFGKKMPQSLLDNLNALEKNLCQTDR